MADNYNEMQKEFIASVRSLLSEVRTEVSERNDKITDRDGYIYGDLLEQNLDIPIGHDHTPVNWLRRTVEIHKIQFMGRPFQVISTYDTKDSSTAADDADKQRLDIENKKQKEFAELRKGVVDDIIRDNGGRESCQHIRPVKVISDAAKPFCFALRTISVTGAIQAKQSCVFLWVNTHNNFQLCRVRHVFNNQIIW